MPIYGQRLQLADCALRHAQEFKYLAVYDEDEIILPRKVNKNHVALNRDILHLDLQFFSLRHITAPLFGKKLARKAENMFGVDKRLKPKEAEKYLSWMIKATKTDKRVTSGFI